MLRQGPHQVAQKSIKTGVSDWMSCSKDDFINDCKGNKVVNQSCHQLKFEAIQAEKSLASVWMPILFLLMENARTVARIPSNW